MTTQARFDANFLGFKKNLVSKYTSFDLVDVQLDVSNWLSELRHRGTPYV